MVGRSVRCLTCAIGLAGFAAARSRPLVAQDPDRPGAVVARVVDSAGAGIGGVEVMLVNTAHRTTTDSVGRFSLPSIQAGEYLLQARRIGYAPKYLRVFLAPGEEWGGQIVMIRAPTELPELVSTVPNPYHKPPHLLSTRKYDDFYRRRQAGRGAHFDRDDIEKNHWDRYDSVAEMVDRMAVPGIRGVGVGRCEDSTVFGGGQVLLFLDGKRDYTQTGPNLLPTSIEAIEIYRGASQIPAEFGAGGGVCAVIAVWTRNVP